MEKRYVNDMNNNKEEFCVNIKEFVDWLTETEEKENFIKSAKQNILFTAIDYSVTIILVKYLLKKEL